MRCQSVSTLKRGHQAANVHDKPREGTKLRALYDKFKANPGIPVAFPSIPIGKRGQHCRNSADIRQLTDYYGLDIRLTKGVRMHGNRTPEYTLVGEWFGKIYVDYLAARIQK